eukprot:281728-Prymnesium_polylepis.1
MEAGVAVGQRAAERAAEHCVQLIVLSSHPSFARRRTPDQARSPFSSQSPVTWWTEGTVTHTHSTARGPAVSVARPRR